MNTTSARLFRRSLGACVLALAGTAMAQSEAPKGDYSKPLTLHKRNSDVPAENRSNSFIQMMTTEGDDTYEVQIRDGEVSAKINGKAVPDDRIRRSDDKIELLDKDGSVIHTFDVTMESGGARGLVLSPYTVTVPRGGMKLNVTPRFRVLTPPPADAPAAPEAYTPPKVMLGINMSEPDQALLEKYDLKEHQSILIDKVIKDLPADKAGLKKGDIVVAIDGNAPLSQDQFREVLRSKEPGDKIQLKVLRKGESRNLTIELEEFDAEKLGDGSGAIALAVPPEKAEGAAKAWGEEAEKAQQEAMRAWKEAMKHFQTGKGEGQGMVWGLGGGPDDLKFFTAPGAGYENRLAELDKRMADLDRRLADLSDRLAELQKTLEKQQKSSR